MSGVRTTGAGDFAGKIDRLAEFLAVPLQPVRRHVGGRLQQREALRIPARDAAERGLEGVQARGDLADQDIGRAGVQVEGERRLGTRPQQIHGAGTVGGGSLQPLIDRLDQALAAGKTGPPVTGR
jgi:hypothetical protein